MMSNNVPNVSEEHVREWVKESVQLKQDEQNVEEAVPMEINKEANDALPTESQDPIKINSFSEMTMEQAKDFVKQIVDEEMIKFRVETDELRKAIEELKNSIEEMGKKKQPSSRPNPRPTPMDVESPHLLPLDRSWTHEDGKIRRVPASWKFPFENLLQSYRLWHLEDQKQGTCAMKHLRPSDVDFVSRGKKNLEEFRFMMTRLDLTARGLGLLKTEMTEEDVELAFKESFHSLGIAEVTSTGKPRDFSKFKWTSAMRIMPVKKRNPQEAGLLSQGVIPASTAPIVLPTNLPSSYPADQLDCKVWKHPDDKERRVPPDWPFPLDTVLDSYRMWHLGIKEKEICPLKHLRAMDVEWMNRGKRILEEFRSVMLRLDSAANDLGLLKDVMTDAEVNHAYELSLPTLGVPDMTPGGKNRDFTKLKWSGAYRFMRAPQDGAFLTAQAAQTMATMAAAATAAVKAETGMTTGEAISAAIEQAVAAGVPQSPMVDESAVPQASADGQIMVDNTIKMEGQPLPEVQIIKTTPPPTDVANGNPMPEQMQTETHIPVQTPTDQVQVQGELGVPAPAPVAAVMNPVCQTEPHTTEDHDAANLGIVPKSPAAVAATAIVMDALEPAEVDDETGEDDGKPPASMYTNGIPLGEATKDAQGFMTWDHDGLRRRVPPNWTFPCENLLQMYKLWHLGDTIICPMKHLRPKDVAFLKRGRQNLEEVRFMMTTLDLDARDKGLLKTIMKERDVISAFDVCLSALTIPESTNTGKPRIPARMKWSSALRIMKVKKRTPQKGGYVQATEDPMEQDAVVRETVVLE